MSLLPLPVGLVLLVAANVASAMVFQRRGPRAIAALCVALLSFLTPLFTAAPPLVLTLMAMFGFLAPIRWLDLWRDRRDHPAWLRVWLFASPFDVRRVVPMPRALERRRLALALVFVLLFAASFAALEQLGPTPGSGPYLRWLIGAVLVYVMVDGVASLLVVVYHALGLRLPELHRAPILSRSVSEFWSERWNRSVHGILDQHCFRPLARKRRALLGIGAAFVASGLLHAWLVLVPLRDLWLTLSMSGFFLAQGLLVLFERKLGVQRWRPLPGHTWTVGWMVVTTPLFVEPMLRILEL